MKARYAKLIGSVGKRNQRIKNEIRVDPFVTSRCVSIDSRQMICESIGPKRLIDKFPRETVFYDKGQKLCRADCICLRIVNLPNAFESNIQFVEKNAMIGNYEFDTANVTASDGLNSLSFVESRQTVKMPCLIRKNCGIHAFRFQVNNIPKTNCIHAEALS